MSIQIFILSKLMEGNNYPYKLKKQLSHPLPLDKLGGLTESKLYYHFDALTKQGLIETVEIIKEDHRPDKQVFGITAKGREELPKKIYKLFESTNDINEMVIAIATLKYVDPEKVVEILERNLNNYKAHWGIVNSFEEVISQDQDNEKLRKFLGDYYSSKNEHTIYWIEELIKKIQQREL